MEIKTGYFAYTKKYIQRGYLPISIAQFSPKWYLGYKEFILAPSKQLLSNYKSGFITEERFKEEYTKYLDTIPFESLFGVWRDLVKRDGLKGVVLMCYEKYGDFCHRHILAEYIKNKFGIDVVELLVA